VEARVGRFVNDRDSFRRNPKVFDQIEFGMLADRDDALGAGSRYPAVEPAFQLGGAVSLIPAPAAGIVSLIDRIVQGQNPRARTSPRQTEMNRAMENVDAIALALLR
jgi:hypothetical protein